MRSPCTHRPTWLCPDAAARERMLDMDARLRRPRAAAFAVLGVAVAATIPEAGLVPVALLAVAILGFAVMGVVQTRIERPEIAVFGAWAFSQVVITVAIAQTGGADSYAIPWLLVPIVTLPARFGSRGVAAGVALTVGLALVATTLLPSGGDEPGLYRAIFPVAGLVAIGLLSTALMRSDAEHRNDAVLDALTGLLNRRALGHRLEELESQAAITGQPVAVVAGDVDHFKRINDAHGHAIGDAVLVEIGYRLRKALRAYDLVYRLGGEEFLVVLPGADVARAVRVAEHLRETIASEPVAGIELTMSFGVAGSGTAAFDAGRVLAWADEALYAAKAGGRDRVECAGAAGAPALLAATAPAAR